MTHEEKEILKDLCTRLLYAVNGYDMPKFKAGDWIVNGDKNPCCIKSIFENHYELYTNEGYEYTKHIKDIDNYYHLWTIQDAKDGDVLSFDNEYSNYHSIGIFKRIANKNELNGNTYRCYVRYGGFEEKLEIPINGDELHHCGTSAHPATKEQRDLLFHKMEDAGYVWDAEKKELTKIEQKPTSSKQCADYYNENSELKMPRLTDFENEIAQILFEREYDGSTETDADIARGRLEYELVAIGLAPKLLDLAIKEKKPAWSEEDEDALDIAMRIIDNGGDDCAGILDSDKALKWLKSLKDRIRPQLKQELSEEDYNEIETIACHLDNIDNEGMAEVLRSIRDKYWLKDRINLTNKNDFDRGYEVGISAAKFNQWKPTREQLGALSDVWLACENPKTSTLLNSLYNDLKKL